MSLSISVELTIIVPLILANGFFAAAEIAVLTSRRSRLEQQARSGGRSARAALELAAQSEPLPDHRAGGHDAGRPR